MRNQGNCQQCQTAFSTNRLTQRFCSPKCRLAAQRRRLADSRREYDRDWKRRHREQCAAYTKRWWHTRGRERARVPPEAWYRGPCLGCGVEVVAACAGVKRLYCSRRCKRKVQTLRLGQEAARAEARQHYYRMKARRPDYARRQALRRYERQIQRGLEPLLAEMRAVLLAFRRRTLACCETTRDELAFVEPYLANLKS